MDYQAQQIVILRYSACVKYASDTNGDGVVDASADANGRAGVILDWDFYARTASNNDTGHHQEKYKD